MAPAPKFVASALRRTDASGQIARQLRTAISEGVWQPGERLPTELQLAETFEVARATAREALKLLAATGIVESVRGSAGGTYVTSPSANQVAGQLSDSLRLWYRSGDVSVREVDEARRILEGQCIALAAERRDEEDLEAIRVPLEASRDASLDWPAWLDLDTEFHTAITRASGNRILELSMTSVHMMRPATNSVFVRYLDRARVVEQHTEILEGIEAGDAGMAEAAFDRHIAYLDQTRVRALADRRVQDVRLRDLSS